MNNQLNTSTPNKAYLLSEGFTPVGKWKKESEELDFSLDNNWKKLPAVYIFIDSNDQVLYIGRTVGQLWRTLYNIEYGYEDQLTNHRLHYELLNHLEKPLSVEILAYTNAKDRADLAAYFDEIKANLLQHTSPLWNLR